MNINEQKRYVFKKAYVGQTGTIPEGSEIAIVHGCVYFNGGMTDPGSSKFLLSLVSNPKAKAEYLEDTIIPYNKV